MTSKFPLSVAIITKDEEARLPDCLKSVSFADEIVLVDSGSTDRTVEIARAFGARVFVEDWKGFGPQKQSAVSKCNNEWVLMVDADEIIPSETRDEILEILKKPSAGAYSFPRKNFFHGRWIRHAGWWPDRVVRLVRKDRGRFVSETHERWVTDGFMGSIGLMAGPIEHFSFSRYSDMLKAMDGYSTSLAEELYQLGARANVFSPIYHGAGMFLKSYFFKLGFLDGMDGLVISLTKAGGSFFKYAKLLAIGRHGGKG